MNLKVLGSLAVSVFLFSSSMANAEIFKAETSAPGGATHAAMVALAKLASEKANINIQINDGQTLTSSALKNAQGKIDFSIVPPAVYTFMTKGIKMYSKLAQDAIDASKNLKSIFAFTGGAFHPTVYESSGIKSLSDMKGKRVFTGPPSGAASVNMEQIIEIATGLKPGDDYEAVHLAWGEGAQAMMDGKLDVFFNAVSIGSANVEQISITKNVRFLGLDTSKLNDPEYLGYLKVPGRAFGEIPPNTYVGQVNETAVTVPLYMMIAATRADLSDDVVYEVTKAFWENLEDVHQTAAVLKAISKDTAFKALNIPLHPGAYRYYQEQGFNVPEKLIP